MTSLCKRQRLASQFILVSFEGVC